MNFERAVVDVISVVESDIAQCACITKNQHIKSWRWTKCPSAIPLTTSMLSQTLKFSRKIKRFGNWDVTFKRPQQWPGMNSTRCDEVRTTVLTYLKPRPVHYSDSFLRLFLFHSRTYETLHSETRAEMKFRRLTVPWYDLIFFNRYWNIYSCSINMPQFRESWTSSLSWNSQSH